MPVKAAAAAVVIHETRSDYVKRIVWEFSDSPSSSPYVRPTLSICTRARGSSDGGHQRGLCLLSPHPSLACVLVTGGSLFLRQARAWGYLQASLIVIFVTSLVVSTAPELWADLTAWCGPPPPLFQPTPVL